MTKKITVFLCKSLGVLAQESGRKEPCATNNALKKGLGFNRLVSKRNTYYLALIKKIWIIMNLKLAYTKKMCWWLQVLMSLVPYWLKQARASKQLLFGFAIVYSQLGSTWFRFWSQWQNGIVLDGLETVLDCILLIAWQRLWQCFDVAKNGFGLWASRRERGD